MPSSVFKYPQLLNISTATKLTITTVQHSTVTSNLLPKSQYQQSNLLCTLTIGSLTNCKIYAQVTFDGTNWFDQIAFSTGLLVANATVSIPIIAAGAKAVRVAYLATGTNTGSGLVVDHVTQQA